MTNHAEKTKTVLYPGGETPKIGELFSLTIDDFTKNIGPYALAGVGIFVISIPVVLITLIVTYILVILGFLGTMVGVSALINSIVPRDIAFLGPVFGLFSSVILLFVLVTFLSSAINTLMAPFNASLMREIAAYQRGEGELSFSSAFSTITVNLASVVGISVLLSVFAVLLASCCYIPALLVPLFFAFAPGLVALHGIKAIDAFKGAGGHAKQHLKWHGVYMLAFIGANLLANNIPIVGPTFMCALHVRALRILFGDDKEPVFTTDIVAN